ncbi:MAG: T9SS type A sorting domain-containing protein [Bacteroidetes bacterium]|nr:T9SS type A sorting domain-containing protein [Bacteroidota bacterium]
MLNQLSAQTVIQVNPSQSPVQSVADFRPGIFFVPKTQDGFNAYFNSNTRFNGVRLNIIESALNNSSNLSQCLAILEQFRTDVLAVSQRSQQLVLIFEKMPAWLSSSNNSAPAQTPGWSVLNTKPPASWTAWQTVVDSIVSKINNAWGLDPYYEVWNEPDIGSWTGTEAEYMKLFRTTRAGIKAADASAKAGGPAVNYWANGLSRTFIPEKIHADTFARHSLIAHLLDSLAITAELPDFLSWHNFTPAEADLLQAATTVNSFLNSRQLPALPLILSEWNAPSALRDVPAGFAFVQRINQSAVLDTYYAFDCIAAWQDFSPSPVEFHQDYGLISYGALEKPVWKMLQVVEKHQHLPWHTATQFNSTFNLTNYYSVSGDTLRLMLTNQNFPGILAAFQELVYSGCTSVAQLNADGYLNIQTGDVSRLDSALRNLITVSGTLPSDACILAAQSVYAQQDSLWRQALAVQLQVLYLQGNTAGKMYRIDSTHNNIIYRYDSLRSAGYSQANAITYLLPQQQLQGENITLTNGQFQFAMQPNSFIMIEIPGVITGQNSPEFLKAEVFPNPAGEQVHVQCETPVVSWTLCNIQGQLINSQSKINTTAFSIPVNELGNGVYILHIETLTGRVQQRITVKH